MIARHEAKEFVETEIANYPKPESDRYIILDEETIEKEWGWVFFYTSEKWHQTQELKYAVAGNAPLIVERSTGNIVVTGTAEPVENYIKEYECSQSKNA
ncbi:Immunity protein 35 [Alteromonadaceae bacterium Bs31]|nr:Immunity protein 35 [Alteromonadaceae bacterium Bs31]